MRKRTDNFPEAIATAELTVDDVPTEGAPWAEYSWFALTARRLYRGCDDLKSLDAALAAIRAGARPCDMIPRNIDGQRALLCAMQRRWRWMDGREPPNMELCRAIVGAIRQGIERRERERPGSRVMCEGILPRP